MEEMNVWKHKCKIHKVKTEILITFCVAVKGCAIVSDYCLIVMTMQWTAHFIVINALCFIVYTL